MVWPPMLSEVPCRLQRNPNSERVHLSRGPDDVPRMELEGVATVSRTVGFG